MHFSKFTRSRQRDDRGLFKPKISLPSENLDENRTVTLPEISTGRVALGIIIILLVVGMVCKFVP